ncbi:MAG TPA: TonB family protein [Candidatus Sulfotelmatobacter sp.]|nr:TonB family protein [Candidatus Sulfotelmatobacter sp.]
MPVCQINARVGQRVTSVCTLAVVTVALLAGLVIPSVAQRSAGRKVLVTVKPEYPETLKFAQIGGLVRLSATVQPNGTVSQVEVRGGNPILAEKAQAAVMKWKYAPAANQTVEEISLSFSPH